MIAILLLRVTSEFLTELNADDFAIFTISGTNSEVDTYHKVTVSHLSGATSFSNAEDIIVTFGKNWY